MTKMEELAKIQAQKESTEKKDGISGVDLEKLKQEIGGKQKSSQIFKKNTTSSKMQQKARMITSPHN